MTPRCPRCGSPMQREQDVAMTDGRPTLVSHYSICRPCGALQNLNPDGTPYVPPTVLDEVDLPRVSGVHKGPQHRNHEPQSRAFRDGCRFHPHCLECPEPDCIAGSPEKEHRLRAVERQAHWFEGKDIWQVTTQDVLAEAQKWGVLERSVWRRLERMRRAAA